MVKLDEWLAPGDGAVARDVSGGGGDLAATTSPSGRRAAPPSSGPRAADDLDDPHGPRVVNGASSDRAVPTAATGTATTSSPEAEAPDGATRSARDDNGAIGAEEFQRRLGARLRAVRRSHELRLQDVETRSDGRFKAVVVGSYERGDRAVSASKLVALAAFYGVPVAELLPDDEWPRGSAREGGLALAVDRLGDEDQELLPLRRLVQHVQWLRGDYNGRVLSLRGDDLRTVAIALGVDPDHLEAWLDERGLLVS